MPSWWTGRISEWSARGSVREHIAYVGQETFLFSASIRDNIAGGKTDVGEDGIVQAAKAAYLHDFIAGLPSGYDTFVGENGMRLSGGERQRVAIARALIKDAPIILSTSRRPRSTANPSCMCATPSQPSAKTGRRS